MKLLQENISAQSPESGNSPALFQTLLDVYTEAEWPAAAKHPKRRGRNVGPHGWRVEGLSMNGIGNKIFRRNPGTGPLNIYTEQLGLTVLEGTAPGIRLTYSSLPELADVTYDDIRGVRTTTMPGEHYNFTVDSSGVFSDVLHQTAYVRQGRSPFTDRDRPHIEYDHPGLMPVLMPEGAQKLDFTAQDVERLQATLGVLALDLEPLRYLNGASD
jgi:hypothetical protein